MSLELQQYCYIKDSMMDRGFKKVGEIKPGESKGMISVKASGDKEIVIFECEQDGSAAIYRCNPDNTESETIIELNKGESFEFAIVGKSSTLNINPESTLYNITHR